MVDRLVLVRHGDAEFFGPDGTDLTRRLTPRGARALRRAYPATFSRVADAVPTSIWVSPATRALETARIAAEALGMGEAALSVHDSLYDQDDDAFLAELFAEGRGCVVAVGHVPFMARMLWELTGIDRAFSKGSVACLSFAAGKAARATLEWFVEGPNA